jgi:hypothetical protein
MNRTNRSAPARRRVLVPGLAVVALGLAWLVHGWLLSHFLLRAIPWWAERSGYAVKVGEVRARFFGPVGLKDVVVSRPGGTEAQAPQVELGWASWGSWGWSPSTWIGRLAVRDLSGRFAAEPAAAEIGPAARTIVWPAVIEVTGADVAFSGSGWAVACRGLDLLLDASRTGRLRAGEAAVEAGRFSRTFRDLRAPTVWRDGVAYFSGLTLDHDVTLDSLSVALAGASAVKLEAQMAGGYVYADVSGGGSTTKAAVNALNLALDRVAEFAGLGGGMEGTVDLAKLTFNGDPERLLSGQISLRVEARDFAWRGHAVEELTLGLSVAGRRVRINEGLLRQQSNRLQGRGTLTVPADPAAWRDAPFDFEVAAELRDLRSMTGLFGPPWNGLSGGLTLDGRGHGRASDGEGWLKVRGWDLRARGVPATSLQADLELAGRDLKLTALEAQSGADFLRGRGVWSLDESLAYQGRLELRAREVARYLEPLGRFAPDWAREGGVLLFWDGDGTAAAHSGVASLELVRFSGDLNPVPVNGKLSASYAPGNLYVSRFLLDRGPLSLSSTLYFGEKGLAVQDLQLFSRRARLLRGEFFLPLSLEAVLARRPWEETVLPGRDVYAFLRSDDLDLASLVQLFGQQTALRGKAELRLDAKGPWEKAEIDGRLSVTDFAAAWPALRIPASGAAVELRVRERQASVAAELRPRGGEPMTVEADLSLIGRTDGGGWTLIDGGGPLRVQWDLPPTDLAGFAPVWAGARVARGRLSGKIAASGTWREPRWDGALELRDARLELPGAWLPVDDLCGRFVFEETRLVLEDFAGRAGGGTLGLTGRFDWTDRARPVWEVRLRGRDAALYADAKIAWQATPELEARGDREAGTIKGHLDLAGTTLRRGLSAAPHFGPTAAPAPHAPLRAMVPPLAGWELDVRLDSSADLIVGPDGADGRLRPDLRLGGTAADPILLGTVHADGLRITFPSRLVVTAAGGVHFTRARPWLPLLDLSGSGEAGPYDIRAGAFGPAGGQNLFLSSVPPLEAGQIVLLLTTGVMPVPSAAVSPPALAERLNAEPAWLDLGRIRGLLGWATGGTDGAGAADDADWTQAAAAVGYEWGFR